jgi:hypothetical protein
LQIFNGVGFCEQEGIEWEVSLTFIVEIPHCVFVCVCLCLQNTASVDTTPWDPKCKQGHDLKQAE